MQDLKKQKGFSIIEVVVSLFMLGVILLVYAAANNTLVLNRIAKHQQLAYRIAANEMESLRSGGYTNLPATGSFNDPLLANLPTGTGSIEVGVYDSRTKQVTVRVRWTEPGTTVVKSASVVTLVTSGGVGQ